MSQNQRIIIQNLIYQTETNQTIFNNLNLTLTDVKTGLIGRNGIGKSTLLKLLIKELKPTSGSVKTFGIFDYCPQDFTPYYNLTIAQFFNIDKKLQALENISQGSIEQNDFTELADDWDIKERITTYLENFSIKSIDLATPLATLSNGELTKLFLAKIFHAKAKTDFIILDEPTNNLDINIRIALYKAIQRSSMGMLIISHDIELLELMDQILSLTELGAKIYGGNFSFYQEQKQIEHDAKQQHLADAKKTLKKAMNSIQSSYEKHDQNETKGRLSRKKNDQPKSMLDFAKNRSEKTSNTLNKRAARLIKTAEQELKKAKNNMDADYNIQVSLPKTFVPNDKIVAILENVSFRYFADQSWLLKDFNLIIQGPEKIAITGLNGSGKTTLLKLIQKTVAPESGIIQVNVTTHYLDQKLEILNQEISILDNYKKLNPNVTDNEAYKNLASFLFRNKAVMQKVKNLSSGEKLRAALASILLAEKPPELLMLDEPTNHLDLENLACLESILKNYEGALLIISHDIKFLESLGVSKTIKLLHSHSKT